MDPEQRHREHIAYLNEIAEGGHHPGGFAVFEDDGSVLLHPFDAKDLEPAAEASGLGRHWLTDRARPWEAERAKSAGIIEEYFHLRPGYLYAVRFRPTSDEARAWLRKTLEGHDFARRWGPYAGRGRP